MTQRLTVSYTFERSIKSSAVETILSITETAAVIALWLERKREDRDQDYLKLRWCKDRSTSLVRVRVLVGLTETRSSLVLTRTLLRFQETVGSGWPRGGTQSNTAGSPAATTTSLGACRKSSLSTEKKTQRNLISFRSFVCLMYLKQRQEIRHGSVSSGTGTWPVTSKDTPICLELFSWVNHLLAGGLIGSLRKCPLLCLHVHDCSNPWQRPC